MAMCALNEVKGMGIFMKYLYKIEYFCFIKDIFSHFFSRFLHFFSRFLQNS